MPNLFVPCNNVDCNIKFDGSQKIEFFNNESDTIESKKMMETYYSLGSLHYLADPNFNLNWALVGDKKYYNIFLIYGQVNDTL